MSDTRIVVWRNGIERCLYKAATAPNHEIETLWLYVAESYRFLVHREQREQERGTWQRNKPAPLG